MAVIGTGSFSNGDANPSNAANCRQNTCIDNGFRALKKYRKVWPADFSAPFCPCNEILATLTGDEIVNIPVNKIEQQPLAIMLTGVEESPRQPDEPR